MTTLTAKITPEPDENIDDQQIEQEIMDNIHKINFKDKSSFQKSLDSVFDEYEFEQADYDKFWKNPIVQKIYLDIMRIEIQNLENNLNLKRKNVENLQTRLEFKKARKSTYEIDVKYVRFVETWCNWRTNCNFNLVGFDLKIVSKNKFNLIIT